MNNIETKVKSLNLVPSVTEEIVASLEKNGIIEDDRLDIILPALSGVLQISKAGEGKYSVTLISAAGVALTKDDKPWTISDWIADYSFEPANEGTRNTISYEDSLHPTSEQLADIASGKLKVLPAKKTKSADGSVPASTLKDKSSRNEVSLEDVASGKTKVDMSK